MKKHKTQSFMRRISLNMLLVILISHLAAYSFSYLFLFRSSYDDMLSSGQNMLSANLQIVDEYFLQIDHFADTLLYNSSLNNILKAQTDTSNNMQTLQDIEQIFYHAREDLRFSFYKENTPDKVYSIYTSDFYDTISNYKESDWYQELTSSGQNRILLTNIYSEEVTGSKEYVHSIIYQIEDLYSNDIVGYLRIDMDLMLLPQQLMINETDLEGIEILSEEGEILFSNGEFPQISEDTVSQCLTSEEGGFLPQSDSFLFYDISSESGWIVAVSISTSSLRHETLTFFFLLLTTLLFSLALCIYLGDRNSQILNQTMDRLTEGMTAIREGDLTVQVDPKADDEISRVMVQFNEMVNQINELVAKVETNQALLDEAQIKALQQQINPHFIYNSLETVMGMASEGMNDEIIDICTCISAMLRYNTDMQATSTIKEELLQVQNYSHVMEMRMGDSFRTVYDVDSNCLPVTIVKFSLQPLVENAINHGMANITSNGIILLRIRQTDDRVEITVKDNGCGMPQQQLEYLNNLLSKGTDDPLHLMESSVGNTGLLNVHLRLRLYFDGDYQIRLTSALGSGTEVCITIPFKKEDT